MGRFGNTPDREEREMTAEEWVRRFAAEVGTESPSDKELDQILKLAPIAAHGSERTAAPVACWIGGGTGVRPRNSARSPRGSIPLEEQHPYGLRP
jgi:Domain of unknown function (DUF6457)